MDTASSSSQVDGRTARRIKNRTRILDAAWELLTEGKQLNAEGIAERAGVSVRSLYNHFSSARELVAGLYERGNERVRPLRDQLPDPALPLAERAHSWAEVRGDILDRVAAIRWQALIAEERNPELQPETEQLRRRHREEVARIFPELSVEARAAVVAISSSLGWRSLRRHQGLSLEEAKRVIEQTVRRFTE